jgi:uncharacterized membrane protein
MYDTVSAHLCIPRRARGACILAYTLHWLCVFEAAAWLRNQSLLLRHSCTSQIMRRADVCATCCSLLAGCHLRSGAQLDMYVVAEQQAIDGML